MNINPMDKIKKLFIRDKITEFFLGKPWYGTIYGPQSCHFFLIILPFPDLVELDFVIKDYNIDNASKSMM